MVSPYTPFQMSTGAYRYFAAPILDVHNDRVDIIFSTPAEGQLLETYSPHICMCLYLLDRFVIRVCIENRVEKGI
jgi:hypothetical protein